MGMIIALKNLTSYLSHIKKFPSFIFIIDLNYLMCDGFFKNFNLKYPNSKIIFQYSENGPPQQSIIKPMVKRFLFCTRKNVEQNEIVWKNEKKLVTRLPNFPDRRIRYVRIFLKIYRQTKNNFRLF